MFKYETVYIVSTKTVVVRRRIYKVSSNLIQKKVSSNNNKLRIVALENI